MIYSLNGVLIYSDSGIAVVECGGVGYKCTVSLKTSSKLPKIGDKVFLFTYMAVREDSVDLFGFADKRELDAFRLVTSVNGVGPKVGVAILSDFTPDQIILFVASGDYKSLTAASGVGAKLAQRIVLELKDKVGTVDFGNTETVKAVGNASGSGNAKEAIEALSALGYSVSEASLAVGRFDPQLSVEELIKSALKQLSRQI